jgi:hypothetical protein
LYCRGPRRCVLYLSSNPQVFERVSTIVRFVLSHDQ